LGAVEQPGEAISSIAASAIVAPATVPIERVMANSFRMK